MGHHKQVASRVGGGESHIWESISRKPSEFRRKILGLRTSNQRGRKEKEDPSLSAHIKADRLSHSFKEHRASSVTGTLLPQTAPTQTDTGRGERWIQERFAFSSGLKTKRSPHAGQETASIKKPGRVRGGRAGGWTRWAHPCHLPPIQKPAHTTPASA